MSALSSSSFSSRAALLLLALALALVLAVGASASKHGATAHDAAGELDEADEGVEQHGGVEDAEEELDEELQQHHHASHFEPDGEVDEDFDHEAVAGSRAASEEFKTYEPQVSKERLNELVKKMDLNKNGTVEKAELEQWVLNSFKNLDNEQAAQEFQSADEDRNGLVSWEEYVHRQYGYKPNQVAQLASDNSTDTKKFLQVLEHDKQKFERADLNKDKGLDKNEFAAFHLPLNHPHMLPLEGQYIFVSLDTNKNGLIDLPEFVKHKHDSQKAEKHVEEIEIFKKYDANKDGNLDKLEFFKLLSENIINNARLETEHLFKETDANKDAVLTADEILLQADLWVGSQATDYGAHIQDLSSKHEL